MAVPKGYKHHWTYRGRWKEKKIRQGLWKISFKATKRTNKRIGGPKRGFTINWGFKNMKQRAVKTGPGTYQTHLTGLKYVRKAGYRKRR